MAMFSACRRDVNWAGFMSSLATLAVSQDVIGINPQDLVIELSASNTGVLAGWQTLSVYFGSVIDYSLACLLVEEHANVVVESSARLTCDMPGVDNNLVKPGAYRVGAIVGGQTIMSDFEYKYQQ